MPDGRKGDPNWSAVACNGVAEEAERLRSGEDVAANWLGEEKGRILEASDDVLEAGDVGSWEEKTRVGKDAEKEGGG